MVPGARHSRLAALPDITGGRGSRAHGIAVHVGAPGVGLTRDDIEAIFRLLRCVEPSLARRSAETLGSHELGRAERNADLIASGRLNVSEVNRLYDDIRGGLLMPGASHIEAVTVVPLLREVTAHFEAHYERLGTHPKELSGCDESNEVLIAAFRTGDPDLAENAVRDHLLGCEQFALHVLDLD